MDEAQFLRGTSVASGEESDEMEAQNEGPTENEQIGEKVTDGGDQTTDRRIMNQSPVPSETSQQTKSV